VGNRPEKLIEETGLKISSVTSTTLSASTRAMLEAIVVGERDPATFADMAEGRLRAKIPQLRDARRIARFSDASAFIIGQILAQIDMLDAQLATYAVRIEDAIRPFARPKELLMTILGISDRIASGIIGSIGADMTVFAATVILPPGPGSAPATTARPAGTSPQPPL
jgi:transposase